MKELYDRCETVESARLVTVMDLRAAVALSRVWLPDVAVPFCHITQRVSMQLKQTGCDMLQESGAIAHLMQLLKGMPSEPEVVLNVCFSLFNILLIGTPVVRSVIKHLPDCETLLRDAFESGHDLHNGKRFAAVILGKLGFQARSAEEAACML